MLAVVTVQQPEDCGPPECAERGQACGCRAEQPLQLRPLLLPQRRRFRGNAAPAVLKKALLKRPYLLSVLPGNAESIAEERLAEDADCGFESKYVQ